MSVNDAVPRRRGDVATTLPLVGHCLLVLCTMMASAGVLYAEADSEDRCRRHDSDCIDSWVQIAAWTALFASERSR
jgi:hypothetical protein